MSSTNDVRDLTGSVGKIIDETVGNMIDASVGTLEDSIILIIGIAITGSPDPIKGNAPAGLIDSGVSNSFDGFIKCLVFD